MASFMPNPQASSPQPDQGGAPASPQANPLQGMLGKIVLLLRQLGQQNTVIQEDLNNASQSLIQALQKVSQASGGPPQQAPAPQQQ
jgi:hypothetical protein